MIRPSYQGVQPAIMKYLHNVGGEAKFEDVFQDLRELYPKMRRAQLAANVLQLHWNNHLVWEGEIRTDFENWLRSSGNV